VTTTLDPNELNALWDFADPAASEARFRERLAATSPGSVIGAELTTQLARSLGLQDRFVEANALLDTITSDHPVVLSRVALEHGRVLNSSGSPEAAVPYFREALAMAGTAPNDILAVDALHMLAIADRANAAAWTQDGVERATASHDPHVRRWLGPLHNNLGWSLHDAGSYEAALSEFERALVAYEATGTPDQVHVAHWSIARCLRSLGRFDEALATQRRLAATDEPDPYVADEIATLELALAQS